VQFSPVRLAPCTVLPIRGEVAVRLAPGGPPDLSNQESHEWQRRRQANPRLFDGPILSLGLDPLAASSTLESVTLTARRDRYARLVIQPAVATGVCLLAATAVVFRRDVAGVASVLLVQRSVSVNAYPGLWEFGPSGGVAERQDAIDRLSPSDLAAALAAEVEEELGLHVPLRLISPPMALLVDGHTFSADLVMTLDATCLPFEVSKAPLNWENDGARWITLDDLRGVADPSVLSPPTRVLLASLSP